MHTPHSQHHPTRLSHSPSSSPPPPPPPLSTSPSSGSPSSPLSHYTILSTIGEGTFGRVTKVLRLSDHTICAMKSLYYGDMNEKEKQQLVAEVNILRELSHQHIVRYYDRVIDRTAKKIYIVMEYCGGGDLASLIRAKAKASSHLPAAFVYQVLHQTAQALQLCHSRSFLHRDLKPHNLFLTHHNQIKLGDFGLARILPSPSAFANTHAGTPYYMPPEQVRGEGVGAKGDVWSLGCLVYEMCCLMPPFTASNPLQLARRIERGEWDEGKVRERYGEEMCAMIRGMLCVDVRRRWGVDDVLRVVKPKVEAAAKREERKAAEAGKEKEREGVRERPKLRDVTNEREVVDRERRSRETEVMCAEKESRLKEWEERLGQRDKQQQAKEQQLKDRERAVVQMEKELSERAERLMRVELKRNERRSTLTSSPSFPPSPPSHLSLSSDESVSSSLSSPPRLSPSIAVERRASYGPWLKERDRETERAGVETEKVVRRARQKENIYYR